MITVNLRPGQKRKRAAGNPFQGVLESLRAIGSRVKDPWLLAGAASWIAVLAFLTLTWLASVAQLRALEPRLEQVRAEHKRFKTFLDQKRKQEVIRDSLAAQIATIRSVDGNRYVWPHLLDEVTKALPAYTWLVDMSPVVAPAPPPPPPGDAKKGKQPVDTTPKGVYFQLNGRTVDIQAYTRFLRQLEASPWISDVTPVSAQTVVEQERAVTAFTIRAMFKQADSAYVRTVPLSQSVR
jgi:Tfp pilus assembly protein PilN